MNSGRPTIRSLLARGETYLDGHDVPNARRNAEWMLCSSLSCELIDLYVHADSTPAAELAKQYWDNIERRAKREPLQYILGATEFMSLPFVITRGVFVPRPETECLVELAERKLRNSALRGRPRALDLCCGSGIIAVSLALRVPGLSVTAVDSSELAVETTRKNAAINEVSDRVRCVQSDAVEYLKNEKARAESGHTSGYTAVLCNPPYIETDELADLPPEVRFHEPADALNGGPDGLSMYRAVAPLLYPLLERGGIVLFEIGATQGSAVAGLFAAAGIAEITVEKDYGGNDRVVSGVKALLA